MKESEVTDEETARDAVKRFAAEIAEKEPSWMPCETQAVSNPDRRRSRVTSADDDQTHQRTQSPSQIPAAPRLPSNRATASDAPSPPSNRQHPIQYTITDMCDSEFRKRFDNGVLIDGPRNDASRDEISHKMCEIDGIETTSVSFEWLQPKLCTQGICLGNLGIFLGRHLRHTISRSHPFLTLLTFFLLFSLGRASSDRRSGLLNRKAPVFSLQIAEEIAEIDDGEIARVPCLCSVPSLLSTHLPVPIPSPLLLPLPRLLPHPPDLLPRPTCVAPMLQIAPTGFYHHVRYVSLKNCEIVT